MRDQGPGRRRDGVFFDFSFSALRGSTFRLQVRFEEAPGSRSFFTEIIASISDIKFGQDGRHILSRDYMTLKLWDINMDSGPVATFQVHEYLRPQLCDLYESDSIFDKFECCLSGDGLRVANWFLQKLKLGREPTIVESFNRTHKTKQGMGGYVDKRSEAVMTFSWMHWQQHQSSMKSASKSITSEDIELSTRRSEF
ncbi:serine/threonine protein phosphatase 2A 55 kDa regulatory subunit B alpha isoform-like isoform X2 [Phoenix dactylifera]|uniref:Serine/threonine protein phosphatase 2A 55 kDa regulatory subunit B alpha isoform-like isoform X2 n=1 Tax=Phoenix dactylifera TaxID=42345 RepID=A0A8B9AN48_PHODC|nr:serine/threonine protein phosphatase 2A 55 kDa regulatory subunit B alpha isoform-like isoform X2 [Phoenix dactylifera]